MNGTPVLWSRESAGAAALSAVVILGVLVAWNPGFWATSVLHIGIAAIAAAWLAAGLRETRRWTGTWLYVPLGALALWGPAQIALHGTVYAFDTSTAALDWFTDVAAFVLAAHFLRARAVRDWFLDTMVYFGFSLIVIAILQSFTAPKQVFWLFDMPYPVIGPFVYKNQFAAYVELLLPIAIFRMLTRRQGSFLFGFMSATMFAAVVMSASRVGTILLSAEIILVLAAAWGRRMVTSRLALQLFAQIFILLAACTAVVGWEALGQHFQDQVSGSIRGNLLRSSMHMIQDRPWLGWGLGSWRNVYPAYALFDNGQFANAAHNDWAQWTAEGGVFFAVGLLTVFIGAALLGWRWLWGVGVFFVMIHSLFDYPTREPVIGVLLFVVLGGMVAASAELNSKEHSARGARRVTNDHANRVR